MQQPTVSSRQPQQAIDNLQQAVESQQQQKIFNLQLGAERKPACGSRQSVAVSRSRQSTACNQEP
jgi:hypothetical protein